MKTKLTTLMLSLILLAGQAFADPITWTGDNSTSWSDDANWDTGLAPDVANLDYAVFDTLTLSQPVIAGSVSVSGLQFNAAGWLLSGGTLNLGNTLTVGASADVGLDATALTSGVVKVSSAVYLDNAAQTWLVGTGGTLSFDTVRRGVTGNKIVTIGDSDNQGTVIFGGTADNDSLGLVVNGGLVIFNKTGAATARAVGAGLTINSGTVRLDGTKGAQIYYGSDVSVFTGGVLDLNGGSERVRYLTATGANSGGGLVTNSDAVNSSTLTITGVTNTGRPQYIGDFSGNLTIVIGGTSAGSGGMVLTGTFTNTGDILNNGNATYGADLQGFVNNTGKIVNTSAGNGMLRISAAIGANVTEIVQNSETQAMEISGTNFSTGGLTIKAGTVNISNRALGVDNDHNSGTIVLGDAANTGKAATLNVSANGIGNTGAGSNPFEIVGTGSRTISATNYSGLFSGLVTLHDGVELNLITNNRQGSQLTFSGGIVGTGNLVLQVNGTNITGASQITLNTQDINISGRIINSGTGYGPNAANLETRVNAVIGSNVTGVVQNSENSRLILSAANLYRGDTQILQGQLNLGNVNAVQFSTVNVSAGGTLGFTVSGNNLYNLGGLAGAADVSFGNNSLKIGGNDASTVYAGALIGSGSVGKAGTGTLTLNGANTYTGRTNVSGGVLLVNGSGDINSTSGVIVSGGTLRYDSSAGLGKSVQLDSGALYYNSADNMSSALTFNSGKLGGTNWNGTLSGLTVSAGQIIAPGNGIGAAVTDAQTWGVGGAFEFELGNVNGAAGVDWDLLTVSNALNIGSLSTGDFTLTVIGLGLTGFDAGQNYDWDFIHYGSLSGAFNSNLFSVDTANFGAAYDGEFSVIQAADALVLHYEAVPEPSVWTLMLSGALLLLALRFGTGLKKLLQRAHGVHGD